MNGLWKTLGAVALFALLFPAAAGAQQASLPPAGITVVGTGTATVAEWVQEVNLRYTPPAASASQYEACANAIAALGETIHAAGIPASALVASATVYTSGAASIVAMGSSNAAPVALARVDVPPASIARFIAVTKKNGWKAAARLVPRDLAAARDSAYKAAYADAHARAESIAAADGHHLGKLLNVTPALGDYFGSLTSSVASIFETLGKGSMLSGGVPEIAQSATFTFEITP
ncbi:MAG TPA: hypothetical protein VIJ77_02865 [Candidatus Tumulicola sp.]